MSFNSNLFYIINKKSRLKRWVLKLQLIVLVKPNELSLLKIYFIFGLMLWLSPQQQQVKVYQKCMVLSSLFQYFFLSNTQGDGRWLWCVAAHIFMFDICFYLS